jgi:hypothetical protein
MTFLTLRDYHDGVQAAISEPKRFRIEDMPDDEYKQLLADEHEYRGKVDAIGGSFEERQRRGGVEGGAPHPGHA